MKCPFLCLSISMSMPSIFSAAASFFSNPAIPISPFRPSTPEPLVARSSPLRHHRPLHVSQRGDAPLSSADALAAAIHRASPGTPIDLVPKAIDKGGAAPSPDFRRLCFEQLDLFRAVIHPTAVLSVYLRLAGSYVMDRLELHRVVVHPGGNVSETAESVVLVATFSVPAGLRAAEAALLNQQVDVFPEHRAIVLPMVTHPFVVGFLVAEIPFMEPETAKSLEANGNQYSPQSSIDEQLYRLPPVRYRRIWELRSLKDNMYSFHQLTEEQRSRALLIARSLAMAYIMDQRAVSLQQLSWQSNVRMSHLVEQIRAPLSNIRTLTKMLSVHAKRSEISYDIIDDILVQGHQMKETLQQLQDAVYFTKANIMRYNEEALKKLPDSANGHSEFLPLSRNTLGGDHKHTSDNRNSTSALDSIAKDSQFPMPPLVLAPQQSNIRPCDVSEILEDLVGAATPLADKQQRQIELKEDLLPLQVAVEESALRQALSNLIEGSLLRTHVGGKVQIFASGALAGSVLVLIDDDGPDMQHMTQMHSLTPFGEDLFAGGMVQDNMTWNFVAGLTVARDILESYGCVVRCISPRTADVALGAGGTRIELWLPTFESDQIGSFQEA